MVIKYNELNIDHLVEFAKDNTIFAAARENGNGYMRIFLIHLDTGNIYTRNGRADSWEHLSEDNAETIRRMVSDAKNRNILTYKINGTHAG